MVFDESYNRVPLALILTPKCAKVDLTPWVKALNLRMIEAITGCKEQRTL